MVARILYRLGNIPSASTLFPTLALYHKYKNDVEKRRLFVEIQQLFIERYRAAVDEAEPKGEPADLTPFLEEVAQRYKTLASFQIAMEIINEITLFLHRHPFMMYRSQEWTNVVELAGLFKSESLKTYYGKFFDQRFIDYLYNNFGSIDRINWRKFEGLTGEFFHRSGFYVEIGKGRNDEGIDARIWPQEQDKHLPPVMLLQCKRQKQKIERVVVKALWADIYAEGAQSGLIVTTSALSPGAKKDCTARAYPITQVDRNTLRSWIERMRSPHTGVFMGE
jgi:restriction system protein